MVRGVGGDAGGDVELTLGSDRDEESNVNALEDDWAVPWRPGFARFSGP